MENKGNKSREDAWVNEENVIERKFDADSGLSRVHFKEDKPEGEWIGRTKDFQNPDGTLKSASQIKGGGNILSVVVPIGSVRKIAGLRGAGSLGREYIIQHCQYKSRIGRGYIIQHCQYKSRIVRGYIIQHCQYKSRI